MKKFFVFIVMLFFSMTVYAEIPNNKFKNYPQGTFKKNRHGQIVQFDNKGKKVGVYRIQSQRYIKAK